MIGGMTERQSSAFSYIKSYIARNNGVSPSFAEIQKHLGLVSKSGVNRIITALSNRGIISFQKGCARSIRIEEQSKVSTHSIRYLFTPTEWNQISVAADIREQSVEVYISESVLNHVASDLEGAA